MQTLYIGVPAGLQGMIFSVSNTILQATINTFGPLAMAGSAGATSVANFIFIPMNSIHHAATSFIGQNTGAKKIEQIKKLIFTLNGIGMVIGVVLAVPIVTYGRFFVGIFTTTEEAITFGITHLTVICVPYFVCGFMDVMTGCIRGMGTSLSPMLVSIFGVCGFRFLWIWVIFPIIRAAEENVYQQYFYLFISYLISWTITLTLQVIICIKTYKKLSASVKSE
jgi:Na+-driven multidrug efflux pump